MLFRYYLYSPDLKTKQKLKYDPLIGFCVSIVVKKTMPVYMSKNLAKIVVSHASKSASYKEPA